MALIIKRRRRLFSSIKRNCLSIIKDILQNITEDEPLLVTDLNIDISFKVAWASFMRMGEFTYTAAEAKKTKFAETGLTRSDISFAKGDQYTILRLKRSKTDMKYTRVQIILATIGKQTYLIVALKRLFI